MTSFNIGNITTINAAQVDPSADRFPFWDNSEAGAARTKAMLAQQVRLLVQGVDTQRGSTKPTQRSDGTSLQSGDRWWDTTDLRWWFWNGAYWLSEETFVFHHVLTGVISANLTTGGVVVNPSGNDLFLVNFAASLSPAVGTFDGSNKWDLNLRRLNSSNAAAVESTISLNSGSGGNRVHLQNTLNAHKDVSALDILAYQVNWVRTGTPGNLGADSSLRLSYRFAKP